ncbi:MAG TPA: hypothetical protein DIS62_01920 [Candidatus Kerfeldbacteria bacterium]|nr:hypothetical protein [Candidatus Kerfeldbacteria bacterium]
MALNLTASKKPQPMAKTMDVQVKEDVALQHKVALLTVMLSAFLIGMAIAVTLMSEEPAQIEVPRVTAAAVSSSLETRYGGTWAVELDEEKGIPNNIVVPALKVGAYSSAKSDETITKDNAIDIAKEFIRSSTDILKVNADNLIESRVWDDTLSTDKNQRFIIAHMQQTYQGVPVENAVVSAMFHNNELVSYNSSWYPGVSASVAPRVTAEQAFAAAKRSELALYTDETVAPKEEDMKLASSTLVIMPIVGESEYAYKLAWKLNFQDIIAPTLALTYYIDATSAAVIFRENSVFTDSFRGYIEGGMYPLNPTAGREENLYFDRFVVKAYQQDGAGEFTAVADDDGYYYMDGLPSTTNYLVRYSFDNVGVQSGTLIYGPSGNGEAPQRSFVMTPRQYNLDWDTEDPTYQREASNVYYHLRQIKDFFNQGPPYGIPGPGLDLFVSAFLADNNTVCNAKAFGASITFSRQFGDCEATTLGSDIIYHEFVHLITATLYASNQLNSDGEEASVKEAYSDYWGATITGNSQHGEVIFPEYLVRDLKNSLSYLNDMDGEYHEVSQILSGALWDFRTNMGGIDPVSFEEGVRKADEHVILAMKMLPRSFEEVMQDIMIADDDFGGIYDGTPHMQQICDAFNLNHGIWYPACNTLVPGVATLGFNEFGIPAEGTFMSSSPTLFPMIGSARAPDANTTFESYNITYRKLNQPYWDGAAVALQNGGIQQVDAAQLGTLDQSQLTPGCFYEAQMGVQTSAGVTSTNVVFQKLGGTQPTMPRMVCVYRTGMQGEDNDACEVIALVTDPKPSFYSMSASDWRRGRNWAIVSGAAGRSQISARYYGMCDPDGADGSCADDCWNITGTNGNAIGGNNGWDNVFCKAGSGCSPVSFSGCPSEDSACIQNAVETLESVYHKVVYLHWAAGRSREYKDCSDDNEFQVYAALNNSLVPWRTGQCSYPRCEKIFYGDVLDGFETFGRYEAPLIFREPHPEMSTPVDFIPEARVFETTATKCATCGCSFDSPYCNTSADVCEQKCWDGQPFNTCKPVTVNGASAASYCKLEDFNTYHTKYACGSLCPGVQCPTITSNFGTPIKLFCNTSIGYCVKCNSHADCNDNSSCTNDICTNPGQLNSSCSHTSAVANDCPAGQQCGLSPSGCYSCGGCPIGQMCSSSVCVRDPSYVCNPLKQNCENIRGATPPVD